MRELKTFFWFVVSLTICTGGINSLLSHFTVDIQTVPLLESDLFTWPGKWPFSRRYACNKPKKAIFKQIRLQMYSWNCIRHKYSVFARPPLKIRCSDLLQEICLEKTTHENTFRVGPVWSICQGIEGGSHLTICKVGKRGSYLTICKANTSGSHLTISKTSGRGSHLTISKTR